MAIRFKYYYKTLEVGRNASDDEIKKGYRKLARKFHPDVNPDNMSAEEREAFRAERRAKWEGMPEEQRESARAKRGEMREKHRAQKRARWESMSEEEREAARAKRSERKAERRARWESMSDEQREAARSRHRGKGEKRHGHHSQRGGD